jgi:hypothetical protein
MSIVRHRLALVAGTVLLAGGASTGIAMAATPSTTAPSVSTPAEQSTPESGVSDGPGGHADPSGNVDHQFNGTE